MSIKRGKTNMKYYGNYAKTSNERGGSITTFNGQPEDKKTMADRCVSLERRLIGLIKRTMDSGTFSDETFEILSRLTDEYSYITCVDYSMACVESIRRLLCFLIEYPVRNRIDIKLTEILFERIQLINCLTYVYFQVSGEKISSNVIDKYLSYLKGSSVRSLAILFLYRVNPEHIRENYSIGDISELSKLELYYGITTGFFETKGRAKTAYKRLKELSAIYEIESLKKSGFVIGV